jgi:predicted glycosyltransferase
MDVVSTRTPALAYPYQVNPEQSIRIDKFARQGLVHALAWEDLEAARLKAKIEQALRARYPNIKVALDGAAQTSARIRAVLEAGASTPCAAVDA